jgi:hypothetical protein
MSMWFSSFLFSGLFLVLPDIVWPFQVFAYIFPLRYGLQAMVFAEFFGSTFEGAALCDPSTIGCQSHGDTGVNDGWICSSTSTAECYGRTGDQILQSMHPLFYVIDSDINVGENIAILLALAVAAKIGYVLLMTLRCNSITTISEKK